MIDKNLLIRLFIVVMYLCILYSFTKSVLFKLTENVEVENDIEIECTIHNDPPVGVANIVEVKNERKKQVKKQVKKTSDKKSMGRFKLTGYCRCVKCCGKSDGITATGTKARAGRTIAVDPHIIPYGSKVIINGKTYIAEDCGGAIKNNKIDIFFNTHEEALEWGVKYSEVYVKR